MEKINSQNQQEGLSSTNAGIIAKKSSPKNKGFLKLFLIFLFVLLLFPTLFYFFFYKKDSTLEQEKEEVVLEQLEGEIYLTLSPLGTNKPNIYKLDVETMELEEFFPESPYANLMAKFSPDGEEMVFVRAYEDTTSQILILDLQSNSLTELTPRSSLFLRNPQFSADGEKIVYWVYEDATIGQPFANNPEENSIYVVEHSGKIEKIVDGVFPFFVDNDNKVLYLSDSGLSVFDLKTRKGEIFVSFDVENLDTLISEGVLKDGLPSWLSLRVNVSNSEDLIILTDTVSSQIQILEMTSWQELNYEFLFKMISALDIVSAPNWPVFSPDSRFVVLQGYDASVEEMVVNMSIFDGSNVFPLRENMLNLEDYDTGLIWITDWIARK